MGRPSLGRTTDEQKAANREYVHKYQRTHREQIIKYRADNPDKQREYQRRYRETHPDKIRELHRKHRYGIPPGDDIYDRLLERQNGACAICGAAIAVGKVFDIDHDHITGDICGLLCHPCNVGIGQFKDSSELLRKALDYNDRVRGGIDACAVNNSDQ
jgi:hypothetical protein